MRRSGLAWLMAFLLAGASACVIDVFMGDHPPSDSGTDGSATPVDAAGTGDTGTSVVDAAPLDAFH